MPFSKYKYRRYLTLGIAVLMLSACSDNQDSSGTKLPDGSVYHGQITDGTFNGYGELSYVDGSLYQGNFVDGVFDGEGSFFYSNGDVYHGQFDRGAENGKGKYTTNKGALYEGGFLKGRASGHFKVEDKKNDFTYKGQMHDWLYSGRGELTTKSETYKGELTSSQYHGIGKLEYADGGIYLGEFIHGQFNGAGVYSIDGFTYSGQFENGEFQGHGVMTTPQGATLEGEFENWKMSGKGRFTDQQGNITAGDFEQGYASGFGNFIGVDGQSYSGGFSYGQFSGNGVLHLADGSHYEGSFSYGQYHGQGRLVSFDESQQELIQEGRWSRGQLVYNDITQSGITDQAEIALEQHQVLLNNAINRLLPTEEDQRNLYFLGVAGDGTQSVFRREIQYVDQQLGTRFDLEGRRVHLINDHETANLYPLATTRSFAQAVQGIAEKMDKKNDVLFVYMSSHGSKEHELTLGHDSINLPTLSADEMSGVIKSTGIKWKVIIVSACYAGGFIPALDDGTTLIMSAADSTSSSFGCSDDSDMTYFGKALFKEVLATDKKIDLHDAFYKAKEIVLKWEQEQELDPSTPQIKEQHEVVDYLQSMLR